MFLVSTSAFYLRCIYKPNFCCEIRNMYKRLYRDYLLASKRSYHSWTVRFILIRSLCLSLRIGLMFFALIDPSTQTHTKMATILFCAQIIWSDVTASGDRQQRTVGWLSASLRWSCCSDSPTLTRGQAQHGHEDNLKVSLCSEKRFLFPLLHYQGKSWKNKILSTGESCHFTNLP